MAATTPVAPNCTSLSEICNKKKMIDYMLLLVLIDYDRETT